MESRRAKGAYAPNESNQGWGLSCLIQNKFFPLCQQVLIRYSAPLPQGQTQGGQLPLEDLRKGGPSPLSQPPLATNKLKFPILNHYNTQIKQI